MFWLIMRELLCLFGVACWMDRRGAIEITERMERRAGTLWTSADLSIVASSRASTKLAISRRTTSRSCSTPM